MDPIVWLPSVGLGLALVLVYCALCVWGPKQFSLGVMVQVMLWSSGVVGGLIIVASVFLPALKSSLASLGLYVVIGGLVVLAESVKGLYRDVFAGIRAPSKKTSQEALAPSSSDKPST